MFPSPRALAGYCSLLGWWRAAWALHRQGFIPRAADADGGGWESLEVLFWLHFPLETDADLGTTFLVCRVLYCGQLAPFTASWSHFLAHALFFLLHPYLNPMIILIRRDEFGPYYLHKTIDGFSGLQCFLFLWAILCWALSSFGDESPSHDGFSCCELLHCVDQSISPWAALTHFIDLQCLALCHTADVLGQLLELPKLWNLALCR